MRSFAALALVLAIPSQPALRAWLRDPQVRRAALNRSLVEDQSAYARTRLAFYESGERGDWGARDAWNPPSQPLREADLGAPIDRPLDKEAAPLAIPAAATDGDPSALRDLGARAFFEYPAQLAPFGAPATRDPERYGLWRDPARGVGGLRRVALADGTIGLALTCATCHAKRGANGELLVGAGADRLDLGLLMRDGTPHADRDRAAAVAAWGLGRVDVISDGGTLPLRIPDLRPVRFRSQLQHSATVAQRDLESLAVRTETLLASAHGGRVRPPHEVALGLAIYLWSLAETLPPLQRVDRAAFDRACGGCHAGEGLTGPPVAASLVGGDLRVATSTERGTGRMSVPSLRGLRDRGPLLHDGSAPDLRALLDPHRPPTSGHRFGLDLPAADRAAIEAFLRRL